MREKYEEMAEHARREWVAASELVASLPALRAEVEELKKTAAYIKLLDIRKLEETYKQIFDVTERARMRCVEYERRMK